MKHNYGVEHAHRFCATLIACTGLGLILNSVPVDAQSHTPVRVSENQQCASCTINVTRAAVLGDSTDPIILSSTRIAVARDSRGHFYAATLGEENGTVIHYAPDGSFVGTIGRSGVGPGEFRSVTHVAIGVGDTLFVGSSTRILVFAPQTFQHVRTIRLLQSTGAGFFLPAERSQFILNAVARTREHAGFPLFVMGDTGSVVTAIRSRSFITDPSGQPHWQRIVGPSAGSRFWSIEPWNYVMEEWSLDGVLTRSLYRDANWFRPAIASAESGARIRTEASRGVGPGHSGVEPTVVVNPPPVPPRSISAIWSDSPSHVWVAGTAPDARWSEAAARNPDTPRDNLRDSMIELIDLRSSSLVQSVRHPNAIDFLIAPGYLGSASLTSRGYVQVTVWRVEFVQQ